MHFWTDIFLNNMQLCVNRHIWKALCLRCKTSLFSISNILFLHASTPLWICIHKLSVGCHLLLKWHSAPFLSTNMSCDLILVTSERCVETPCSPERAHSFCIPHWLGKGESGSLRRISRLFHNWEELIKEWKGILYWLCSEQHYQFKWRKTVPSGVRHLGTW